MTGAELIAAERRRQVDDEGWTPAHDDGHRVGELADAAACLAATEPIYVRRDQADQAYRFSEGVAFVTPWPYQQDQVRGSWYPWRRTETTREAVLVKAGALIAAEIDRLQRLPTPTEGSLKESP